MVMVITRDPVERNDIVLQLRRAGYLALEAGSYDEALRLGREFKGDIDAVFVNDRTTGGDVAELWAAMIQFRPAARILLGSRLEELRLNGLAAENYRPQLRAGGVARASVAAATLIEALRRIFGEHEHAS